MHVRQLTEADARAYRQARLRALREEPEAFGIAYAEEAARPPEATAERLRAHPDKFTLGAFDGQGRLLGVVTFTRHPRQKERHKATISGMYVAPEARRQGVGRALLEEALARARRLPGLLQVHLAVVTRQAAARTLYASLGFTPFGLEHQALRLGDEFLDEEHLALFL